MKKALLLLVVAIMSASAARAQKLVSYQGEVDAGYAVGVGNFAIDRVNVHVINGVRLGEYFSTGVGLGVDYYHQDGEGAAVLPIFLNLKGHLPVSERITPFVSLDIGAGIGLSDVFDGLSGALFTPAVGCAFKVGPMNAVLISLGYNVQQFSESGASLNMKAISLKVGFQF